MKVRGLVVTLGAIVCLTGCGNRPQVASSPTITPSPAETPNSPSPSNTVTPTPSPSPSLASSPSPIVKEMEDRLSNEFNQKTGIAVQSVTCPGIVEVKAISQFECEATADGQNFEIAVEVTNPTGPQFTWSTRKLLFLSKVETAIQEQVKNKNGANVTATCGGKIRAVNQGDSFNCQVSNTQGQTRSAKVTVKDDQGTVDITLI